MKCGQVIETRRQRRGTYWKTFMVILLEGEQAITFTDVHVGCFASVFFSIHASQKIQKYETKLIQFLNVAAIILTKKQYTSMRVY